MIHHLRGKFTEKNPAYVVIDCNGVGYFVHISLSTYSDIASLDEGLLLTHFIVREDGQFLYGFSQDAERQAFKLLIAISGIGANTARMLLSSLSPADLFAAVASSNVSILTKVKGIGQKTAERVLIELRDKLPDYSSLPNNFTASYNTLRTEALSALMQLGFQKNASEKIIDAIIKDNPSLDSVEQLIRIALQHFN